MPAITHPSRPGRETVAVIAIAAVVLQLGGPASVRAQEGAAAPVAAVEEAPVRIPPDELDSLVAPIALYSDPLLAQVLVAATYPLEIIQLQQWLGKNPDLEGDALADAVAEQPWDPSIQSMAALPDLVTRLADDIQWVTDLGNAFLTNQGDVMDAVQRMRAKAKDNGALETNEQQVVTTEVVETKTVIVVQPSEPEVIYVPSYSPVYVYGPPVYPYPPIYYPPYRPGGAFVAFSVGFIWGAARWGGSCCRCGWGRNNININVNNNFNRNSNVNVGGGNWQHNSKHRGGTPYANKATANKYGGSARGDSLSSRQATARQQAGAGDRSGGPNAGNRAAGSPGNRSGGASAGASNRAAGSAGNRTGGASPNTADRAAGSAGNRSGGPSASTANRSGSAANRAGGAGPTAGTGNHIGSRNIPSSSGSRAGGFGGSSGGYSGSNARAAGSRGASSVGSRGSRGGGGRRR